MILYPYQNTTISLLRQGFASHLRQLMVIPTGGGKTVVFSTIVEAAVKKGTLTLVLTDRLELFSQTVDSLQSFGIPVCKINKDNKTIHPDAKLYVGMVETVKRRLDQLSELPFALIICDEAHIASFNKIFDFWPKAHVIGATATPIGKHLYKYYSNLVCCVDTPDLVRDKFLSPCKAFQMQDDLSDLKTDNRGEFTDESLFLHYNKTKLYEGVIESWQKHSAGKKTIVFNCNVEHTIQMTAAFNNAGIRSFCIHSNTPKDERSYIMKEFAAGNFLVLNNCGILTKGYNEPTIESVILNRATTSLILFLQMIGRGSRILPLKPHFTVLDFGLNHDRHGLWNEPREWTLEPPKKKKKGLGAAPVKACKACSAMLSAMSRECPYCGYIFLPTEKELAQGKLVEVTNAIRSGIEGRPVSTLTIPELIECEKTKTMKSTYVWRILRSRTANDIGEYARLKNYKDAWIIRQIETMEAEKSGGNKIEFYDKRIKNIPLL